MRGFSSGISRLAPLSFGGAAFGAVLVAIGVAGCTDDVTPPPDCCDELPVCPTNSFEVESCTTNDCVTVSACCTTVICQPESPCVPLCPPGETQVSRCDESNQSCHQVQQCGSLLDCQLPQVCSAMPSCDDGDDEQPDETCPADEACYAVEICGVTVFCLDHGQTHGCPETAPIEGEPCPVQVTCEYLAEARGCVDLWSCVPPLTARAPIPDGGLNHWDFIWTTCEGGAGGSGADGGGGAGGAG